MVEQQWLERDFYADLGVSASASAAEIKRAYRRLARELHPDANRADASRGERFKAVTQAYSVLSDPAKRREYDQARRSVAAARGSFRAGERASGVGDFGVGDVFGGTRSVFDAGMEDPFGDPFSGIFIGPPRSASRRRHRGEDAAADVELEFPQAVRGATVPVQAPADDRCRACGGRGIRPGGDAMRCTACRGRGTILRSQGGFEFFETCAACAGTGAMCMRPCPGCGGSGVATTGTRTLFVRVPAGVEDGQRIRVSGQGRLSEGGGPRGDLYVTVHVRPDPVLTRQGDDLQVTVPVSFPELVLGITVSVPTPDGSLSVRIPAGTDDGTMLRARGRGIRRRGRAPGDLLITVHGAIPHHLSDDAARALKTYAAAERRSGFDPRAEWAGAG